MLRRLALACSVVVLAGCSAFGLSPQQRASQIEPMLSAAGFHMKAADNGDRHDNLQSVTPFKLRYYIHNGKFHYWFADPDYCHCIFVGDQAAYERFQNLKLQNQLAERQQEAAMLNEEAAEQEEMNWALWPYDPFFY